MAMRGWPRLDPNDPINAGLVGYWSMDGSTIQGTTLRDLSGNGNNGTLVNAPPLVNGITGQALSFNGSTQEVDIGSALAAATTGNVSASCWINTNSTATSVVLSLGYSTTWGVMMVLTPTAMGFWTIGIDGTSLYQLSAPAISTGSWYHVVGVRNGTTLTLYVNGTPVSMTISGQALRSSGTSGIGVEIGSGANFNGLINDVMVWMRALSPAEVQRIYSDTSGNLALIVPTRWIVGAAGTTSVFLSGLSRAMAAGRPFISAPGSMPARSSLATFTRPTPSALASAVARAQTQATARGAVSAPAAPAARAATAIRASGAPAAPTKVSARSEATLSGAVAPAAPGVVAGRSTQASTGPALAAAKTALAGRQQAQITAPSGLGAAVSIAAVSARTGSMTTGRGGLTSLASLPGRIGSMLAGRTAAVFQAIGAARASLMARGQAPNHANASILARAGIAIRGFLNPIKASYPRVAAKPASPALRVKLVSAATRIVSLPMSNETPVNLDLMRQGVTDTRGVDLYPALKLENDTVAGITSFTVIRTDGVTIGAGDLTITPAGFSDPWISANAAGNAAVAINWWQSAGSAIAVPGDVQYQITIAFTTAAGRLLEYDAYQSVTVTLS